MTSDPPPPSPITLLPLELLSAALSYLLPAELAAVDSTASFVRYGQETATELAAWTALRARTPATRRYASESWQLLWSLRLSLERCGVPPRYVDFALDTEHPCPAPVDRGACAALAGGLIAAADSRRLLSSRVFVPRQVRIAAELGRVGAWEAASELLLSTLRSCEQQISVSDASSVHPMDDGAGASAESIEVRTSIATLLVDRLYASTYVRRDAGESRDLKIACSLGRAAVERARAAVLEDGDDGEEEKEDRAVKECKADRPPPPLVLYASPERRLGAALLAHGRALALMGQHVGLGAYTYGTVRGAGCNELFETGCKALLESEDVCGAAGDERGAALAMAARGELLRRRSRALVNEAESSVDALARLIRASIALSLRAIETLRGLRLGATGECAQVMKDVGKVYQVRASWSPIAEPNDAGEARAWLKLAIETAQKSKGEAHRDVRNMRRLMGPSDGEGGDEDDVDGEQEDRAEAGGTASERARALAELQSSDAAAREGSGGAVAAVLRRLGLRS